jgi:hypothetical protein
MASPFMKAAILAAFLVIVTFTAWELYLRSHHAEITYDDGKELWSDKRARVYGDPQKTTVFIGSSRNKYDIDIATWKKLTGECAVQLAIEGNSPLPVLNDLASDKKFKGKLVVDVTEGLFFSTSPNNTSDPAEKVTYYKKRTPAGRASFEINHVLESQFVFLDKSHYSLNAMLDELKIPSRQGVFIFPIFPMEFDRVRFSRQDYMTAKFLVDTNLQNQVKAIWDFFGRMNKEKPAQGQKLDSIISTVKIAVDKIKARGGQVVFVRTPSSGKYRAIEKQFFPRDQYWEKLLSATGVPGIHFEDYSETAGFQCPELSHLAPADAVKWTSSLIDILEREKGWSFPNKQTTH